MPDTTAFFNVYEASSPTKEHRHIRNGFFRGTELHAQQPFCF
jgi:hypothetical protein